jgi:hypothetical protein
MPKCIEEVGVAYDAAEDALVVAEEHEGQLAADGYGDAQRAPAGEEVDVGRFEHFVSRGRVTKAWMRGGA